MPSCTDLRVTISLIAINQALRVLAANGLDLEKLDCARRLAYSMATLHCAPENQVFAYWFFAVEDPKATATPILTASKEGGEWKIDRYNPTTYSRV